jgi:hypothetical protein
MSPSTSKIEDSCTHWTRLRPRGLAHPCSRQKTSARKPRLSHFRTVSPRTACGNQLRNAPFWNRQSRATPVTVVFDLLEETHAARGVIVGCSFRVKAMSLVTTTRQVGASTRALGLPVNRCRDWPCFGRRCGAVAPTSRAWARVGGSGRRSAAHLSPQFRATEVAKARTRKRGLPQRAPKMRRCE